MKNNKGFTLIELLVSIAILAIILVIAIPTYSKISSSVNKSSRNNLIKYLENAASKYAFDTGETVVFVDTLIKEDYVTPDNDLDEIIDPVSGSKMNCYSLIMKKQGDAYDATFVDTNYELKDKTCDTSKIEDTSNLISIVIRNNSNLVDDFNTWFKGSVTLEATSDTIPINCKTSLCEWTSKTGAKTSGSDLFNVVSDNKINTTYTFTIKIYDEIKKIYTTYNKSINIMLDNENPIIYNVQSKMEDNILTVHATDGTGSGIYGYSLNSGILSDGNAICRRNDLVFQSSNKFIIKNNEKGSYLVCVKDNVGNVGFYNINSWQVDNHSY